MTSGEELQPVTTLVIPAHLVESQIRPNGEAARVHTSQLPHDTCVVHELRTGEGFECYQITRKLQYVDREDVRLRWTTVEELRKLRVPDGDDPENYNQWLLAAFGYLRELDNDNAVVLDWQ